MITLTNNQIRQLNMYSIYISKPDQPLFTLDDLLHEQTIKECLMTVQKISQSPSLTVAASFLMRRIGMFKAMQMVHLSTHSELWKGDANQFIFGKKKEYDLPSISMYIQKEDWVLVRETEKAQEIRRILFTINELIQHFRSATSISPLTLWENVFGFLLWQYHVMLNDATTTTSAQEDLNSLCSQEIWEGIAKQSLFARYLNGQHPTALLNTTVRKTCCFSKDVPGLMQCGFCPLK